MSLLRKKPYGCFVTTPCAYLRGGRVCVCLHTHSQPKCQENDNQQGTGAIRGCLLPRASAACSKAAGKHGDSQSSDDGVSSLGEFWNRQQGPQLCLMAAGVELLSWTLCNHKELPACALIAVLTTQSIGVPLAQGPQSFSWALDTIFFLPESHCTMFWLFFS